MKSFSYMRQTMINKTLDSAKKGLVWRNSHIKHIFFNNKLWIQNNGTTNSVVVFNTFLKRFLAYNLINKQ